jgi:hypothetical protein
LKVNGAALWVNNPVNANIRFFATYDNELYSCFGDVLYKSSNQGLSWTALHDFGCRVNDMIVIDEIIYVATYQTDGVYQSTDGINWEKAGTNSNTDATIYYAVEYYENTLIAATNVKSNYGLPPVKPLFKLVDGQWVDFGPSLTTTYSRPFFLRKNNDYLFVFFTGGSTSYSNYIYRSASITGDWRKIILTNDIDNNSTHILHLYPYITGSTLVVSGNEGIFYKTTDNGETWSTFRVPLYSYNMRYNPPYLGGGNGALGICGPGDISRVF